MTNLDGVDTAWRIHQAQTDWTGKVDAKASFIFAIASASMATTVALSATGRVFHDIAPTWLKTGYWLGLACLLSGVLLASLVVVPRLRHSTDLKRESKSNFIYFGHLRHWAAEELEDALKQKHILSVLSRQLVVMAGIAWKKHRWAQWALRFTLLGAGIELFAAWCLVQL